MGKIRILVFVSSVYWKSREELETFYNDLKTDLTGLIGSDEADFYLVDGAGEIPEASDASGACLFLPLSGGVQPLMLQAAEKTSHIGLVNGYLKGFLSSHIAEKILLLNGHPSCTDFFAFQKQTGRSVFWLSSKEKLNAFCLARKGAASLAAGVLLKVGETEPWVINSCREPRVYREKLGTTILSVDQEDIYRRSRAVSDKAARPVARDYIDNSQALAGLGDEDVLEAARVLIAIKNLLAEKGAAGLSMACFAMIPAINTTSCLALSSLNDSPDMIGACEGDLEAAVTLYLAKSMGGGAGWIANPIIYDDNYLDLAHCTAPRCMGNCYSLLPHHETGAGAALQVDLPGNETVTLLRIGRNLDKLSCFSGTTEVMAKQGTCHTQIRVHIESARRFTETMMGTHQILCYGDLSREAEYAAAFLGLELIT